MSDFKMSECFALPLRAEIEKTYIDEYEQHIYDAHGDVLIGGVPEDVDANYVVEAINSHDKLLSDLAASKHKERDMRNAVKVSHGTNRKLKEKLSESQAEVERLRDALYKMINNAEWLKSADDVLIAPDFMWHELNVDLELSKKLLNKGW